MRLIAFLTLLLAVPAAAQARDSENRFAAKGVGLTTCQWFTDARAERSNAYYMALGWIDGYVTGLNQTVEDTFDVASFENNEVFALMLDQNCRRHPTTPFFEMMRAMVRAIDDDRIREASPMVEARIGDNAVRIYRETLRRVQNALTDKGYYAGEVDGVFGQETQVALEAFQGDNRLKVTGLPDAVTLYALLRLAAGAPPPTPQ